MYGVVVFSLCYMYLLILVNSKNASLTTTPPNYRLEECLVETKADRLSVNRLIAGNWKRPNAALKKWTLCYLAKYEVMSRNGVLNQHVVLRDIPIKDKGRIEKIINKCLYQKAHDPVETAWHYLTCFRANAPKFAKQANRI